jgi:hypothetical protein
MIHMLTAALGPDAIVQDSRSLSRDTLNLEAGCTRHRSIGGSQIGSGPPSNADRIWRRYPDASPVQARRSPYLGLARARK